MLFLYGNGLGVFTCRRIERVRYEGLALPVLTGHPQPDHSRILAFRHRLVEITPAQWSVGSFSIGHKRLGLGAHGPGPCLPQTPGP